jgi:hypothetical protein
MRLDEDELEALRRWGLALQQAGREDLAPAGRAILMLLEEVERLRLELAGTRNEPPRREESPSGDAAAQTRETFASTLRGRLQRAAGRDSGSPLEGERELTEGAAPAVDGGAGAAASPEAWIESLRQRE